MKKKILIVDDDPNIAELISDYLRDNNYDTCVACDSKEVLGLIDDYKPDLITMDLNMPKPDGIELLKEIKMIESKKHIPILILSVLANEAERQKLLQGAEAVFSKPPSFKKMLNTISTLLL